MRAGHAGNVRVVEMVTILKTVEDAHIPMAVFLARLLKLGLEYEVLHLHVRIRPMVKGERTLYLYLLGFVLNSIKLFSLTAGTFQ